MHVEECCQALLVYIIPFLDPERHGDCYDIGVGTFAFYCELFAKLGFKTIAVEPLPIDLLKRLCKTHAITLIEKCLSDKDDVQTMYVGSYENSENLNLSSLLPNWWGASTNEKLVQSTNLASLLSSTSVKEITCIKLDVEGTEPLVLKQLSEIPVNLLPKVITFEYGGGGVREEKHGGWSDRFIDPTISSLDTLKLLGYRFTIIIEAAGGIKERILDLNDEEISVDNLFPPKAIYGNIITVRCAQMFNREEIIEICSKYRDEKVPPPPLNLPSMSKIHKLFNIAKYSGK
jgi:FkbM family methyltransferase